MSFFLLILLHPSRLLTRRKRNEQPRRTETSQRFPHLEKCKHDEEGRLSLFTLKGDVSSDLRSRPCEDKYFLTQLQAGGLGLSQLLSQLVKLPSIEVKMIFEVNEGSSSLSQKLHPDPFVGPSKNKNNAVETGDYREAAG